MQRLLAAVVVLAPLAAAADEGRVEITLVSGASMLEVDHATTRARSNGIEERRETTLGGSEQLGFRASWAVSRRLRFEAGLAVAPSHEVRGRLSFTCPPAEDRCPSPFSTGQERLSAYLYDVSLSFEVASGGLRPFLVAGLGGVTYDAANAPGVDPFRPDSVDADGSSLAAQIGAGVKVPLGARAGVRLEAREIVLRDHFLSGDTETELRVLAGVYVRLP